VTARRDLAWPVYFAPSGNFGLAPGATFTLTGDEAHHAGRVRRHRLGEWIVVASGDGQWLAGPITEASGPNEVAITVRSAGFEPAPKPAVTVVQALPKSDRADEAIESLTAVGVDRIVPWQAGRSVAKWAPDRVARGLARWRRTAVEASKQSRRVRPPAVDSPVDSAELAARLQVGETALVCHEQSELPIVEADVAASAAEITIVIGPEGGIGDDELALLAEAGAQPVSLGPTVLRTSLAGALAAGLVLARTGRLSARPGSDAP